MESFDHRSLVSNLAEDLAWLEDHCRLSEKLARETSKIRLSAALVRNLLGPFLDEQPAKPTHIVVVGGAGTGKSTVVNLLCGHVVAEANPQAGFTRHPTAYLPDAASNGDMPHSERSILRWSSHLGFLGNLHRLSESAPSNLDEDVYQIRRVTPAPLAPDADGPTPLADCVIWDCPDMTTWASSGYVSRLLETAALADVIIYVASDERYNDAIPTEFLYLLIATGKPVVCCLTKMREADWKEIVAHFRTEVVGRAPNGPDGRAPIVPCFPIPSLTPAQLQHPAKEAARWRIPIINQVTVLCEPAPTTRRRSVSQAIAYLSSSSDGLLALARQDLEALEAWRAAVLNGQMDFNKRYRNEYLQGEQFRRFDDATGELLRVLELPSSGFGLGLVFRALREPYRFVRGLVAQIAARPESVSIPERTVLEGAFDSWLDQLRSESLRRTDSHPVWKHVASGFQQGLADLARDRFHTDFRKFELAAADESEASRRGITEQFEQNPALLNGLRVSKLILDLVAIGLVLWLIGFDWWLLLAVPVAVSLTHQIAEWITQAYVNRKREQARYRQETLMATHLSAPLGEWLAQWPVTGGSTFERLQRALRRVPEMIRELTAAIQKKLTTDSTHHVTPRTDGSGIASNRV